MYIKTNSTTVYCISGTVGPVQFVVEPAICTTSGVEDRQDPVQSCEAELGVWIPFCYISIIKVAKHCTKSRPLGLSNVLRDEIMFFCE